MGYAFTFRNTSPDTAPVAPAHGSTGTLMRRKRRGRSHIVKACPCIPSSATAEPAPDMPELEITGQNHGARHSEHKAHAKAHNTDQKDRAQTATVSMCWERNSEISYPQQRQHTQTQHTFSIKSSLFGSIYLSYFHDCVLLSSFKKSAGVFKEPWCFFSHPCAPERSAVIRRRPQRSSK